MSITIVNSLTAHTNSNSYGVQKKLLKDFLCKYVFKARNSCCL